MQDFLRSVHEGMKVYDARNHEIGKVDWVQFGADDPSTPELEATSIEGMEQPQNHSLMNDLAEAFRADEVPEVVHEKLMMQGFIRLDADGIFAADRYIMPDQISSVSNDKLTLKVEKSDLMKTH
ncbi:MAG: hypothetical protein KKC12_10765 [Alphaproteobacteria bacterium]|nr:hypothetical protein [Alphaproteobacteria bacterium]